MFCEKFGIEYSFVDFTDIAVVEKAIRPGVTKLLLSETPANPLCTLTDVQAISDLAKKHGLKHACDSTFATPVVCRPMDHGADMV